MGRESDTKEAVPTNRDEDLYQALDKAFEDTEHTFSEDEKPEEKPAEAEAPIAAEAPVATDEPAAEEPEEKPEPKKARARNASGKFAKQEAAPEPQVEPEIEPPNGFTAEEKAAWKQGNVKAIQKGFQRLALERERVVSQAQNEGGTYRKLAETVAPYIEAAGMKGKDPATAITEALAVVNAINKNPQQALAAIAQLKGVTLGAAPQNGQQQNGPDLTQHLTPLQTQLNTVTEYIKTSQQRDVAASFSQVFDSMMNEKNKAGTTRFPDVKTDEEGTRLASNIGSLVRSPDFQAAVRSRIHGAGLRELVVEAYKWYGGRIDDSEATKSQVNHLAKASRAASSVPGRGGSAGQLPKKKFVDTGDAIDAALDELT